MSHKIYYKLVDVVDEKILTLFHGIDNGAKRTREMKLNKWYEADKKMVVDGSSSTEYLSGFHLLKSKEECEKYLNKFKHLKHKRIVECIAEGIRTKDHSRDEVYLADRIQIVKLLPEKPVPEKLKNN